MGALTGNLVGVCSFLGTIAEAGGVIFPPVPAFYYRPAGHQDMIDHTVGRALAQFGLESESYASGTLTAVRRWPSATATAPPRVWESAVTDVDPADSVPPGRAADIRRRASSGPVGAAMPTSLTSTDGSPTVQFGDWMMLNVTIVVLAVTTMRSTCVPVA